jgi:hypothetical protein
MQHSSSSSFHSIPFHSIPLAHRSLYQLLDANSTYWLRKYEDSEKAVERFKAMRDRAYDHQIAKAREFSSDGALSLSFEQKRSNEILLKHLQNVVQTADARLENARNMSWWITQHLRGNYRRKALTQVRFQDTWERLIWIADEG